MQSRILIASILGVSLASSSTIPPASVPETVSVFADTSDYELHVQHVQMLYDLLGGSFVLPIEGANGQNVTVTGIHLYKNHTDAFMGPPDDLSDMDFRLDQRAPITTDGRRCAMNGQYGDRLLTHDQQVFIDGKFCHFLSQATPSTFGLIGLTITNLICSGYACQGVWTVGAALAGQYISPGIQMNCDASLKLLNSKCGAIGGQQQITVSGEKYIEEAFATTERGTVCTPKAGKGGQSCSTYQCSGKGKKSCT